MRQLRSPLSDDEFRDIPLTGNVVAIPAGQINLRWRANANDKELFFASRTGRLTPSSGTIPCLYLAPDEETSFEELYGDRCDIEEKNHAHLTLPRNELDERVYIQTTDSFAANLYDLTVGGSAKLLGLELGTLYHSEVQYARSFAQRLHDHPAEFDGIIYISRPMQTKCIVLWNTRLDAVVKWKAVGNLAQHLRTGAAIAPRQWLFSHEINVPVVP